jgi:hypothetical protein
MGQLAILGAWVVPALFKLSARQHNKKALVKQQDGTIGGTRINQTPGVDAKQSRSAAAPVTSSPRFA